MKREMLILPPILLALCSPSALSEGAGAPRSPFCVLLDTGRPSAVPLAPNAVQQRPGWLTVPENDRSHAFAGDAVVANDKLAAVVRRKGQGAEVYSGSAEGLRLRACLAPLAASADPVTRLSAIKIVENTPAAVALEVEYAAAGGAALSLRYRLTTGVVFVEVRPGAGVTRLLVDHRPRFVVVPDFFADDVVFEADPSHPGRVGLPAENLVLGLVGAGEGIVVTVWQSNEQSAAMRLDDDPRGRTIRGCEIECAKGETIWTAFLEGRGIWHYRRLDKEDSGAEIAWDWKPPFPAKWRLDVVGDGGLCVSRPFSTPVRPPADNHEKALPAAGSAVVTVVYPLDRSRATPLTALCPIDIMRSTLGVGPCQYVLDAEGIGAETHPTPDDVTQWVERQFERKREKRSAETIKQRLDLMVDHVRRTEARIEAYREFARRIRDRSSREAGSRDTAEVARECLAILDDMDRSVARRDSEQSPSQSARRLADAVVALIGQAAPYEECRRFGEQIRSIGADQDRALAVSRMALRRLREHCRTRAAAGPEAAAFARSVREEAQAMLRKKPSPPPS